MKKIMIIFAAMMLSLFGGNTSRHEVGGSKGEYG